MMSGEMRSHEALAFSAELLRFFPEEATRYALFSSVINSMFEIESQMNSFLDDIAQGVFPINVVEEALDETERTLVEIFELCTMTEAAELRLENTIEIVLEFVAVLRAVRESEIPSLYIRPQIDSFVRTLIDDIGDIRQGISQVFRRCSEPNNIAALLSEIHEPFLHDDAARSRYRILNQLLTDISDALEETPENDEPQDVTAGATEEEINFQTYRYTYEKLCKDDDSNERLEKCVICQCDFENDEVVRRLNCMHQFHEMCANEWLTIDRRCPICRVRIDE